MSSTILATPAALAGRHQAGAGDAPVRYIKLGHGSGWAVQAIEDGVIPLGYSQIPHQLALRGDRAVIVAHLVERGRSPAKAASFATEVLAFYQLGPEAIWITFASDHLWWARADPEVVPLVAERGQPQRYRRTLDGWHNTDRNDRPLRQDGLSTSLTKVAAYQQTICRVEASDYLLRKLNGEDMPEVRAAAEALGASHRAAEALIVGLHWVDFETLVDLILTRGGWHRVSALGGTQKDADLIVEQPVTGETASVQVKSSASQATLDEYIARFDASGQQNRLIFACHSPKGVLDAHDRDDVIVWTRNAVAEMAVRCGLLGWLMERAA